MPKTFCRRKVYRRVRRDAERGNIKMKLAERGRYREKEEAIWVKEIRKLTQTNQNHYVTVYTSMTEKMRPSCSSIGLRKLFIYDETLQSHRLIDYGTENS